MKKLYLIFLLLILLSSCTSLINTTSVQSFDLNYQTLNTGINRILTTFNNPILISLGEVDQKWVGKGNRGAINIASKAVTFSNINSNDAGFLMPFQNTQWLEFKCLNLQQCVGGGCPEGYTVAAVYGFCHNKLYTSTYQETIKVKGFMINNYAVEPNTTNVIDLSNSEIPSYYKVKKVFINNVQLTSTNNLDYIIDLSNLNNGLNTLAVEFYTLDKPGGNFASYLNLQGGLKILNGCKK